MLRWDLVAFFNGLPRKSEAPAQGTVRSIAPLGLCRRKIRKHLVELGRQP